MSLTKNQLKQLIKEELEATIAQEGIFDMFGGGKKGAEKSKEDIELGQALFDLEQDGAYFGGIKVPSNRELAQMRVDDPNAYADLKRVIGGQSGKRFANHQNRLIKYVYAAKNDQEKNDPAYIAQREKRAADAEAGKKAAVDRKRAAETRASLEASAAAEAEEAERRSDYYAGRLPGQRGDAIRRGRSIEENKMDFTKDHKNKVNSLLMEKWGYGKKEETQGFLNEQQNPPTLYVLNSKKKVIGSFNSSRPKGEKFLPNKVGKELGHTAGPNSPADTTMVDSPRELGGFELNESNRQRKIMLAEAKRIEKIHKEMLSEVTAVGALQFGLDIAGLAPGFGEAADLANAAIYLKRGKPFMAALSVISMIPVVGDVIGKGGKLAMFMTKSGDDAAKASIKLGGLLKKNFPKIKAVLTKIKSNKLVGKHADDMLGSVSKYIDDAAKGTAKVGQDALQKVQQALLTKPVKAGAAKSVKDVAKGAIKNRAARKRKEFVTGANKEEEEEEV